MIAQKDWEDLVVKEMKPNSMSISNDNFWRLLFQAATSCKPTPVNLKLLDRGRGLSGSRLK